MSTKKKPTYAPLETILWRDHWSRSMNTWYKKDDLDVPDDMVLITTGYIIKETKKVIHVAMTIGVDPEDSTLGGHMCIMKNAIIKRTKITNGR